MPTSLDHAASLPHLRPPAAEPSDIPTPDSPASERTAFLSELRVTVGEVLRELVQYRELLYLLTRRDVVIRYKQSVMGIGWAVFVPLTNMLVFSAIFTRVAPIATDVPYPLFAYSGLLPWSCFASALRFSVLSLTSNGTMVTKVYFPRELLPFSAILVSLVDLAVGASVLAVLMAYYGIAPRPAMLFLPVVLLVQVAFTAGVALVLAMCNLFFRDVKYVFELVITLWMFATAVVFPVENVGGVLGFALRLNPMTPIIEGYRAVLLRGELPDPATFGGAAVVAFLTLFVGWVAFHRAEFSFAENV